MEKFCNGRVVVQQKRRAHKKGKKGKSKQQQRSTKKKNAQEENVSFYHRFLFSFSFRSLLLFFFSPVSFLVR